MAQPCSRLTRTRLVRLVRCYRKLLWLGHSCPLLSHLKSPALGPQSMARHCGWQRRRQQVLWQRLMPLFSVVLSQHKQSSVLRTACQVLCRLQHLLFHRQSSVPQLACRVPGQSRYLRCLLVLILSTSYLWLLHTLAPHQSCMKLPRFYLKLAHLFLLCLLVLRALLQHPAQIL